MDKCRLSWQMAGTAACGRRRIQGQMNTWASPGYTEPFRPWKTHSALHQKVWDLVKPGSDAALVVAAQERQPRAVDHSRPDHTHRAGARNISVGQAARHAFCVLSEHAASKRQHRMRLVGCNKSERQTVIEPSFAE